MYHEHMAAGDSSIDILYLYSMGGSPPLKGRGRGSEDRAWRSEKGFSPDFF